MSTYMPPQPPKKKSSLRHPFVVVVILLLAVAGVGIFIRVSAAAKLKDETHANATPVVSVIAAGQGPAEEEIVLPGSIQPWHDAVLYARVNGYLKSWVKTMGDKVKRGDLIAEIETPEVDAQLRQAEADLKTAEANNVLAQSTAVRWKKLLKTNSVSKQEADEKSGDALAKAANLAAAKAAVDRLKELESFKQVRAPFDGVISSRTTDIGALINSGSGQQALFRVVQSDRLRVYVRVPQSYSSQINRKMVADVYFDERPGQVYQATFITTAEAIDSVSQTMLTEFKIDNRDGTLLGGGYAQVHLKLPASSVNIRVPVNTLLFRAEGPRVAIVDTEHHAQLVAVKIGRDFGNEVEILSGLESGQQVIVNPPDSLLSGQEVRLAEPKKAENAAPDAAAKPEAAAPAKDEKKE